MPRFLLSLPLLLVACGPFEGDEPGECTDGADNDRDGDFDLHDQMATWEDLVGSMTELLGRMRKING